MNTVYLLLFVCLVTMAPSGSQASSGTPINPWIHFACTPENIKTSRTYYCDSKGNIHCLPGWTDKAHLCQTPNCTINGTSCLKGNCSRPYTCECEIGWTGQFCDKCVCLPGCINGYCGKSFECICEAGWSGMFCDKPTCGDCVHGECVMPGMCVCHPGWSGPNCTICEQRSDCQFGRCINEPFECSCYDGYSGSICEKPICREGCHPDNGLCMMPDTCWCKEGWTGINCTECVPYWNCQYGTCEKPWECICNPGYFGVECNDTKNVNGNWGAWTEYSGCSLTCGAGVKTRTRHCNNPSKAGNGTYCSIDGSSATETIPCVINNCSGGVSGNWGPWGAYSNCSTQCGHGTQTRTRACISSSLTASSQACPGAEVDVVPCYSTAGCPINGKFGPWTQWSPCTAKCTDEKGDSVRRRYCDSPPPSRGGLTCADQNLGPEKEQKNCTGAIPRQSANPTADCFFIIS